LALSHKQQVFINHYLECWNATEAARRAGYSHPNKRGPENVVKSGIAEEIARRIEEKAMSADEALIRLAEQARGSMAEFVSVVEGRPMPIGFGGDDAEDFEDGYEDQDDDDGPLDEVPTRYVRLDMVKAAENGKLHLVKKLQETKYGLKIELYDAQAALEKIGRAHGLFTDKHIVSFDWKQELEDAGFNANEIFERIVNAADDAFTERLSESHGDGGGGSAEAG